MPILITDLLPAGATPILHALGVAARIWAGELNFTLTRYVIFATGVWLVLWVLLAAWLRARKIRDDAPPSRQLITEFLISLRSMAIFATVAVGIDLADRAGFYPLQAVGRSWGPVWFWTSLAITIVVHDAYFNWTHRLMHLPRFFRRTHRRHHRSHNPSPFTAYSFDVGEAGLMVLFFVVWPMIFPMAWGVNGLFMLHQIVRNTLLHSGYELMPARRDGRPLLDFMTTTTHHDLHHGQAGWNYAAWFTWWDRWMGTEHPDYYARYAAKAWRPFGERPAPQAEPVLAGE
jgi:sterol desaturase/sphingolipid hydroxylase (fatty acid hydroxylase superfamily)